MKKENIQLFCELMIYASLFIAAFVHLLIALLRWFLPIDAFPPFDYIPGLCAILVSVLLSLYLAIGMKYYGRFRIGQLFLIAIMLLYIWSCFSVSDINQVNEFEKNNRILYDTIVLFFFFYPLGHFIARWKNPWVFRIFLNVVLLIGSVCLVSVLHAVFHGKTLDVPSGKQIYMQLYYSGGKYISRLEMAMNPNTTAQVVSIAVLLETALFLWNKTPLGKVLAVAALSINYVILVLTGSRTSLISSVLGCVLMLFFYTFYRSADDTRRKAVKALVVSLVFLAAAFFLERHIHSVSESIYNPPADASAAHFSHERTIDRTAEPEESSLPYTAVPQSYSPGTVAAMSRGTMQNLSASPVSHVFSFRQSRNSGDALVCLQASSVLSASAEGQQQPGVLYTKLDTIFSGRLRVWGYAVKAITASPATIRHGVTPAHIFLAMDQAAGRQIKLNTHNQFLDITLGLGVPALIVFILFIIYTIYNSVTMFRYARLKPLSVITPVLLYVFLLSNLTEATLIFHRILPSYFFFFICGWINERGVLIRNHMRKKHSHSEGTAKTRIFAAHNN